MRYHTSVCEHIDLFYSSEQLGRHPIGYPPIVYWLFDSSILGGQATLEPSLGPKGCQCHYDIKGIDDSQAAQVYQKQEDDGLLDIHICLEDGTDRPINVDTDHEILLSKRRR